MAKNIIIKNTNAELMFFPSEYYKTLRVWPHLEQCQIFENLKYFVEWNVSFPRTYSNMQFRPLAAVNYLVLWGLPR